jgi:arabinose-5-phosphate isomerase
MDSSSRAPDEPQDDVAYGRKVLETERTAIDEVVPRLDARFAKAVAMVLACRGQVVVTGVGKSGLIGQKVSATLASTGTSSIFLHAGDAVHGDLGRVRRDDVVLALSYRGTTEEVLRLVPLLKKLGAALVAITASADSPLGTAADVALTVGNVAEACPIGLAPTSSTTAMLAMGDALAMTVAHRKRFDREEFALFHPGGAIGRLLVTVGEVMRDPSQAVAVPRTVRIADVLTEMSRPGRTRTGTALVLEDDGRLAGVFTDGDLRRGLVGTPRLELATPIADAMTRTPRTARRDELLADAYKRIKEMKLNELPVVDDDGRVVGLLHVQDVVEWGVAF